MKLKDTLNLPDPDFTIPMKADLPSREPAMLQSWIDQKIYSVIQKRREGAPTFVLHDGPPYTNGPIHIGTALNKVLKDFVVKSQTIMGKRAPYVPGYDNHGLPIEMAVMKKFNYQKITPDLLTLRKACREHAEHYIGVQTEQFVRLGIFGTWDRPYTSMEFKYEAEIVRVFKRLVEKGFIYRGLRPVLWSPTSRTALADTEIVYQDHTSTAIIVSFPLKSDTNQIFGGHENVSTLIWTTTPWTIPANLAVAYHPEFDYDLVRVGDQKYLLLHELVGKTMEMAGLTVDEIVASFKGAELEGTIFAHPVFGRDSIAVLANYVTTEDGTGVVHTAPGHGRDDFYTGQKYGLDVLCPVDEKGVLTEEAGEFAGVYYKKCDTVVVDRLRELGRLLDARPYHHSYPHAERDGNPVIFRATEQWFISVEKEGLRLKMLDEIQDVQWVPANGEKRLSGMISGRPDWCVSRQRPWGVGIPIFYGAESGVPVLDPAAIEAVASMIETHGSDGWYSLEPSEILPAGYRHPETGETEFRKERDVFDVWFDSACTNLCVLEGEVEPTWKENWPADLFLEGSDQHRGWFNVSLIVGTAIHGEAPYRAVVTHGMVVDDKGQKISKRLGNNVDPNEVCAKYGADVLRTWVASVDFENDMPCSDKLLQVNGETYRTLRNTMRFLLGNLSDFDASAPREPEAIDQWVEDASHLLVKEVLEHYENYSFNKALAAIHNFCVNQLSKVYLDAIKDRMYCDGANWPSRRAAQAACFNVLNRLVVLASPLIAYTAEEVYQKIPLAEKLETVHAEVVTIPGDFAPCSAYEAVESLLEKRAEVFAQFEIWKQAAGVKDSQDVSLTISTTVEEADFYHSFGPGLANLFKMAEVTAVVGESGLTFALSPYEKCERCRLRRADVALVPTSQIPGIETDQEAIPLSKRDRRALGLES